MKFNFAKLNKIKSKVVKLILFWFNNIKLQINQYMERGAVPVNIGERRADDTMVKNGTWYNMGNNSKIIVSIIAIAVVWMLTGIFSSDKDKNIKVQASTVKVKFIDSKVQPHEIKVSYLGIAEPIKIVNIRPEAEGVVTKISVHDGQFVKSGTTMIQLDEKFYHENIRQAQSNLQQEKVNFTSVQALYNKQLSSKSAYFKAKKDMENAESALSKAKDDLRKTSIIAQFDGYIGNIKVHEGDVLSSFQEDRIAQFYDISKFKIVLSIPQKDIDYINKAKRIEIERDEAKINCEISFISRSADVATKAFRIDGVCDNKDNLVNAYESIRAQLVVPQDQGLHYVPKSAIILEMNGELSVKTIEDNSVARSNKISIMDEDSNGFWIAGLPEHARIITLGQQFITNQEKVDISTD